MKRFSVIAVAAGKGTRMGTADSKQHLPLGGVPILVHTLQVFERLEAADEMVLVVGAHEVDRCQAYVQQYALTKVVRVVAGGAERQASVYEGIKALAPTAEWVLVHDGVRPFVTEAEVLACFERAMQAGAAVLGVPVKDTIKLVGPDGTIEGTPERKKLWAVHTPQAFQLSVLRTAHERAISEGFLGTDDAMLVERYGHAVQVVPGSYDNIKITTPEDLLWAEWKVSRDGGEQV